MDPSEIDRISVDAMDALGCHTAILYGSWARGQATPTRDVDLLYIRREGPSARHARIVSGVYVDAFIYSEASLETPEPALLRLLGGQVLREADGCGTALLAKLQALHDRGPEPLSDDARQVTVLWSGKMLERFRGKSDIEARYRRMQLFTQALEDYFALRGLWCPGPKAGFRGR